MSQKKTTKSKEQAQAPAEAMRSPADQSIDIVCCIPDAVDTLVGNLANKITYNDLLEHFECNSYLDTRDMIERLRSSAAILQKLATAIETGCLLDLDDYEI